MRPAPRGFSLVELMLALVLGLIALGAVGSVFLFSARHYRQDEQRSRLHGELRFAMAQLAADLEMAGFFAQVRDPPRDIEVHDGATIRRDCGPPPAVGTWVFHENAASVFARGDASPQTAHASFPCVAAEEFAAGTDIVAVKRLGPAADPLEPRRIYLKTNGQRSVIFRGGDASSVPPAGPGTTAYEFHASVWFVRRHAFASQDPPVPSLCRHRLSSGDPPAMDVECLGQGIEDLQLELGLDADLDGVPDAYVDLAGAPPAETLRRVVALRVHLLARTSEPDRALSGIPTRFRLASHERRFDDAYRRKSLSSVVLLRNVASRLKPRELPQ